MSTIVTPNAPKPPAWREHLVQHLCWYSVVAMLLVGFSGGFVFGQQRAEEIAAKKNGTAADYGTVKNTKAPVPKYLSKDVDFALMWDVWKRVKNDYVEKDTPDTKLFYGALSGVVNSLGDPYSVFLDPETAKRFDQDLSGSFEGIGAEIGAKNGQLMIIAPLPGTPAEKAGIRAGDKILLIDKESTVGMSVDMAVSLIRGKKGTPIVLTVYRDGEKQEQKITITRDTIKTESVKWEMKEGKIGYIRISNFNKDTGEKFAAAVADLKKQQMARLIIDLRGDPGGYLDVAVDIAGYWIPGKTIVKEQFAENKNDEIRSDARHAILKDVKTVVLVDGGSASASEILAGALQDYGIAKLVGVTTFGKGSVQDVRSLPDGSAIKLTIARWLTPKGRMIHEVGITPDVEVKMTPEDIEAKKDPQLEKAIELVK